jgi:dsRNA-specific ribonuclease
MAKTTFQKLVTPGQFLSLATMDDSKVSAESQTRTSQTAQPDMSQPAPQNDDSISSVKRDHDEADAESPEHANKRQKFTNGSGRDGPHRNGNKQGGRSGHQYNGLPQLKRGLDYVIQAGAFSEEAVELAKKLHGLLFTPQDTRFEGYKVELQAAAAETKDEDEEGADAKNPHTNVPPPFALPDKKKFARGPVPALESLERDAPKQSILPPVAMTQNYHSTSLMAAPTSTVLPQAPPITDIGLANAPFMHTSALPAYVSPTGTNSYEPLEFLGDAYLEVIATRLIHARFPLHSVGQKAGLRELLVKNETLAEYSQAYGFGDRLTSAHKDRHGPAWTKVLGDVFEAYLACVIIQDSTDAGFAAAEQWLTELWAPKILQWRAAGDGLHDMSKQPNQPLDAKTDLNRLLVGKEAKLEYREEKAMQLIKEGNRTIFFMGVYLTGWGFQNQHLGSGEGRSKQIAGTNAAEEAMRSAQDIIQLAHQRKIAFERQFKKSGGNPVRGGRGGRGGGMNNRGRFGQQQHAGVGYPAGQQGYQAGQQGYQAGQYPNYPPPPVTYGPNPGQWGGYGQG